MILRYSHISSLVSWLPFPACSCQLGMENPLPSPSTSPAYLDPVLTTAATAGPSSARDQPAQKRTRTRTGCYGCRGRRIKCGEEKPECAHCRRLGLVCQWTSTFAERSGAGAGSWELTRASLEGPPGAFVPERIDQERSLTACRACRASRNKCSHDRPLCTRCATKGIPCEFPATRKVRFPGQPSTGSDAGGRVLDEGGGQIVGERELAPIALPHAR